MLLVMARLKVIGPRAYRKHAPGETYIGEMDDSVRRALEMGVLQLEDSEPLSLDHTRVQPPKLASESSPAEEETPEVLVVGGSEQPEIESEASA